MAKPLLSRILRRESSAASVSNPALDARTPQVQESFRPKQPLQDHMIFASEDSDSSSNADPVRFVRVETRRFRVQPQHRQGSRVTPTSIHRHQSPNPVMIEIAPRVMARLRGAKETMECIERDFYTACPCLSCSVQLFSIADAEYVICPTCRVVSPIGMNANQGGGVALGVTVDQLFDCQAEIIASRPIRRPL